MGFLIAAITCRVAPGYSRHRANTCFVTMSPSKLNAFDRCDELDCSKRKNLIEWGAQLEKSESSIVDVLAGNASQVKMATNH